MQSDVSLYYHTGQEISNQTMELILAYNLAQYLSRNGRPCRVCSKLLKS